jgi:hypothetical protein
MLGRGSGIGKVLTVNREVVPGRIAIILVKEYLGFKKIFIVENTDPCSSKIQSHKGEHNGAA